ncbi:MAG: serine/threonine-protein kinase [Proteobacteria bacterium]|nr:serine/threonine-protein kinase [Pseudomonadota bacterium]
MTQRDEFAEAQTLFNLADVRAQADDALAETLAATVESDSSRLMYTDGEVEWPGAIGRFELLDRIGSGSSGAVYAAYDNQLERQVALKLVRPALVDQKNLHEDLEPGESPGPGATPESSASVKKTGQRLLHEAQTLARISHPNVVQVYDADIYRGWFFLVMELVQGKTLREWVTEQGSVAEEVPWRAILDKFVAAGRGLAAAHAAGLVHRDFKPTNVIVADDGRVYVADFGLARQIEGDESTELGEPVAVSGRSIELTATGNLVGTPAYMSPEQMQGRPADSRSDQYSFCVALYEALYGQRPVVARDFETLRTLATSGEFTQLSRSSAIPVAVRNVLKRGLSVEPGDRYPDMDALLGDLNRSLRPRRRAWIGALLLGAAVVVGSVLFWHVALPSDEPCAASGRSVVELWNDDIAERAHTAFLSTRLPYAEATWRRLHKRMDRYAASLQAEHREICEATYVHQVQSAEDFDSRTLCLARRRRELGALISGLVRADNLMVERSLQAVAALPRSGACRDGAAPALGIPVPGDPTIASRVTEIRDRIAEARVLALSGRIGEGVELAQAQRTAAGALDYSPLDAEVTFAMASILAERDQPGDAIRAEKMMLTAVDMADSSRHDELAADIWLALVDLARRPNNETADGHRWVRRAMAASKRLPDSGERRGRALSLLGSLYFRDGDLAEAERQQRSGLAVAEESGSHPLVIADLWHALANTLAAVPHRDEARDAFERALAIYRSELGEQHPRITVFSYNYARFLRQGGDLEEARQLVEQVRASWIDLRGPSHPDVADTHIVSGNIERALGRLDRATEHALQARDIYQRSFEPTHPNRALPENLLAYIAFERRQYDDMLRAYQRVLAIRLATMGEEHVHTAITRSNIGEALVALERYHEALDLFAEVAPVFERRTSENRMFRALPLKGRGLALLGLGEAEDAIDALERALDLLRDSRDPSLHLADVQWGLARALRAAGRKSHARMQQLAEAAHRAYAAQGQARTIDCREIEEWLQTLAPVDTTSRQDSSSGPVIKASSKGTL